jgi:hypothetical protein
MKEFVTTAERVSAEEQDEDYVEFAVDGFEIKAYRPEDGQLAILYAMTGRHSPTEEKVAGTINFFFGLLDDASHQHLAQRLMDRRDPFGIKQVQEIIEHLVEEWSGRPTNRRRDSSPSPRPTGPKSTGRSPAKRSSASRSTAS